MKKLLGIFAMTMILLSACKDNCKDVECLNGGGCDDGKCICPDGYIGDDCGETENAAFLGDWELPCSGAVNITLVGEQEIPEFTSTITLEDNGNPSEIVIDFTIPIVNETIELIGTVDGNEIEFEEQEIEIPQEVIDGILDAIGGGIPIPISNLTITIDGEGTLDEAADELLVDITIDGGLLLSGEVNCVGVRL